MRGALAGPTGAWTPAQAGGPALGPAVESERALVREPALAPRPTLVREPAPVQEPALAPESARVRAATRLARWRWAATAGIALALLVALVEAGGGYQPVVWLGAALLAVALWLWTRLTFAAPPALGWAGRGALVAIVLYAAWSYASVSWAADPGAALSGSNRTLLYLALFALGAGLQWTGRRLELAVSVYALALGAVAVATLVALARHPDPAAIQSGALASPLGYHNATAALGTIGALVALLTCGSRSLPAALRGALAATATACLELSLLADSRGWLFTLPVIVVAVLAFAPQRRRACAWALIPVGAALATLPWILHGYAPDPSVYGTAAERASAVVDTGWARAALAASLLSGLLLAVLARVDRRWRLTRPVRRAARLGATAVLAACVLSAAAGGGLLIADGAAGRALHQFTSDAAVRSGTVRFAQLGGDRFDFWRVAWERFLAHPLGGLGQDNFAQAYTLARHTLEEPTWVHSLELRLLSGTGLVGFALFFAFIALAFTAAVRGGRAGGARRRLAIAAVLVPAVVWLVHGSVDWFWEIPALSGAAFWWLGAAVAAEPRVRARRSTSGGRSPVLAGRPLTPAGSLLALDGRWLRGVLAILAGGLALLVLGSAYLGEQAFAQASALASSSPRLALADLRQSSALEPLSYEPLALAGAIELRAGQPQTALTDLAAGLRRDRTSWLLWLERGLAEGAAGRPAAERAALAHARALDPLEPVIALAQQRARAGRPLSIAQAASLFAAHEREVVGR